MTTAPHMDTHLDLAALTELKAQFEKHLAPHLLASTLAVREVTLTVKPERIADVLTTLRAEPYFFTQLIDLGAVDYLGHPNPPAHSNRFAVVYHLLSISLNQRVRVTVHVTENQSVPSVIGVYPAANWYEREAWDLFGIPFEGHPDLRRILTDYDFDGHPLRKDFPLEGKVEVYYDAEQKRVAYKPVDLPQLFRHFDKQSQWQGMTGNAPLADADNVFTREEFSK